MGGPQSPELKTELNSTLKSSDNSDNNAAVVNEFIIACTPDGDDNTPDCDNSKNEERSTSSNSDMNVKRANLIRSSSKDEHSKRRSTQSGDHFVAENSLN